MEDAIIWTFESLGVQIFLERQAIQFLSVENVFLEKEPCYEYVSFCVNNYKYGLCTNMPLYTFSKCAQCVDHP